MLGRVGELWRYIISFLHFMCVLFSRQIFLLSLKIHSAGLFAVPDLPLLCLTPSCKQTSTECCYWRQRLTVGFIYTYNYIIIIILAQLKKDISPKCQETFHIPLELYTITLYNNVSLYIIYPLHRNLFRGYQGKLIKQSNKQSWICDAYLSKTQYNTSQCNKEGTHDA